MSKFIELTGIDGAKLLAAIDLIGLVEECEHASSRRKFSVVYWKAPLTDLVGLEVAVRTTFVKESPGEIRRRVSVANYPG
jgi:hypothetical protein